jgi:soluble lytic murein transglycosylase
LRDLFFKKKKYNIFLLFIFILIAYKSDLPGKIAYPYLYKQTVEKYSYSYGVDPLLVMAVIREESHFYPKSTSPKGALGLMQVMPNTAEEIAAWLKEDYNSVNLLSVEDNIRYGTWYLAALIKEYNGNTMLALAAYNAGSGRVASWLEEVLTLESYTIEDIPFKETRDYVKKVLKSYNAYSGLYRE